MRILKKYFLSFFFILICTATPTIFAQPCAWTDNSLITFSPSRIEIPIKGHDYQLLAKGAGRIGFVCTEPVRNAAIRITSYDGGTNPSSAGRGECLYLVDGTVPDRTVACRLKLQNIRTNLGNQHGQDMFIPETNAIGYNVGGTSIEAVFFNATFSADIAVDLERFTFGMQPSQFQSGTYGGAIPLYNNNRANLLFKATLIATTGGVTGQPYKTWEDTRLYGVSPGQFYFNNSCEVIKKTVNVQMGKVTATQITQGTAPQIPFNLILDCPQGTQVTVTATDANNPSNLSDKISLSRDSLAQGVGIQLLQKNGQSLFLNQQNVFSATNEGTMEISYLARYTLLGNTPILPGLANGGTTFTFAYK